MRRLIFLCAFCMSLGGMQLQAQTASLGTALGVQINVQSDACSGQHAVVKVSGGQAPYTFSWNDGSREARRTQLKEGTYACTVTDAEGKRATERVTITQKGNPLAISLKIIDGEGGKRLSAKVSGGQPPYSYHWFGKGLNTENSAQLTLPDQTEGSLVLVVRDAAGCAAQYSQQLTKQN